NENINRSKTTSFQCVNYAKLSHIDIFATDLQCATIARCRIVAANSCLRPFLTILLTTMATPNDHERFMRTALAEARKASGLTSPNPAVGAVLVSKNKIVARGHHRRAGEAHAEIDCLRAVDGRAPKGSTLYVTLEPCSSSGRTPPCTKSLIASGIKSVVVGT